jgi:hypothetical protein
MRRLRDGTLPRWKRYPHSVTDRALYDRAGAVWRIAKPVKDHTKADQERAARILRAIGFKKIQLEE